MSNDFKVSDEIEQAYREGYEAGLRDGLMFSTIPEAKLRKIADFYGCSAQMDMLCEECAEYIVARNKLRRNAKNAYQNCLEEIADVAVMIEQMKLIFGKAVIEDIMADKVERQLERMKQEQEAEK